MNQYYSNSNSNSNNNKKLQQQQPVTKTPTIPMETVSQQSQRVSTAAQRLRQNTLQQLSSRKYQLQEEARRISLEMKQLYHTKSEEYQRAALHMAEAAIQEVESEIQRLANEADAMVLEKASALEHTLKEELMRLEELAAEEADRLADAAAQVIKETSNAIELAARQKVWALEMAAEQKVNRFLDMLAPLPPLPQRHWLSPLVSHYLLLALRGVVTTSAVWNLVGAVALAFTDGGGGSSITPQLVPRLLDGGLEAGAAALLYLHTNHAQTIGAALVTLLFGSEALFHWKPISVERTLGVLLFPGVVALAAATLLLNDLWLRPAPKQLKRRFF